MTDLERILAKLPPEYVRERLTDVVIEDTDFGIRIWNPICARWLPIPRLARWLSDTTTAEQVREEFNGHWMGAFEICQYVLHPVSAVPPAPNDGVLT